MLNENSIQLHKTNFIRNSPEKVTNFRGPPISFRAPDQPIYTENNDTTQQSTNLIEYSNETQDTNNDSTKDELSKALDDFGYKLMQPDNTFTILKIGKFRFKLNKENQWKQSLSILGCVQFAMYVSHFTTECADYAVHLHKLGLQYFFSQFLQAFWVITADPGYKRRNLNYKEHEEALQNGRKIICRKCNSYQDEQLMHCYHCGTCVEGHDHHCDVLGNCIAKNNLIAFKVFLGGCVLGFILQVFNFTMMFSVCYLEDN